jgi:hypothetical protein
MNNDKKSRIKLFRLTYAEEKKDLYLGIDNDLSPEDLKNKFPQFHDYQVEQITQYKPAATKDR